MNKAEGGAYHRPVLLRECLDALAVKPDGLYVDCTLGGGGHSSEILRRLTDGGRLVGIDRDEEAIRAASVRLAAEMPDAYARFTAVRGNFHEAKALLAARLFPGADGVLIDLGVSSHQLDEGSRGFSYHAECADAPLDMRMDRAQALSARDIVNEWDEAALTKVLRDFGEENWAVQIARVIVDRRTRAPIETTGQLVDLIDAAIPKRFREKDASHPARRTFQALRIAVNDELTPLARALTDLTDLLNPGGRLAVIAFHSLEDRIVKTTFRQLAEPCTCPKDFPVCVCGKKPSIRIVTRKPIVASPEEREANPRARSATLRVAEKLESSAEDI